MTFDFHPEADEEFVAAVAYYEDSDPGLGIDFSREIYAAIRNVERAHEYPILSQVLFWLNVARFWFRIYTNLEFLNVLAPNCWSP